MVVDQAARYHTLVLIDGFNVVKQMVGVLTFNGDNELAILIVAMQL